MATNLREVLYREYNGFGDRRYKNVKGDHTFKIDDQSEADIHSVFCGIFTNVHDDGTIEISLTNNAPITRRIKELVLMKGGDVNEDFRSNIRVKLNQSNYLFIEDLAQQIRNAIRAKYDNPNWKWLCPRTAESLLKFARILRQSQ